MNTMIGVLPRRPSLLRVARNQFDLIDSSKRFPLLLAALAGAAAVGMRFQMNLAEGVFPYAPLLIVSVVWPLLVWRGEAPAQRTYHRTMPVNGIAHDLLKVAAGAVWLMLGIALILLVYLVTALLRDGAILLFELTPVAYLNFFTGPLLIYLLVSIIPILSNKPIEWIIGLAVAFVAATLIFDIYMPGLFGITWRYVVQDLALWDALYRGYEIQYWGGLVDGWADVGVRRLGAGVEYAGFARAADQARGVYVRATIYWLSLALFLVWAACYISNRRAPSES